ncbi:hypothetical protein [Chitinimonas sp.]|uniref:hypothetical protein n=1 Tax=Chitinimonas sp. TaxID=1934313 RepID=UPI002F9272B3
MRTLLLGLLATTALALHAQDQEWQTLGDAQYLCGGVGEESMATLQSQRGNATHSLLFVAGARGAYVADVDVSISGKALAQPLQFKADGPICLLKLPKGSYTLEASHGGLQKTQKLGNSKQTVLKWPDEPAA